jgi:glycosyltransferase involved in cell wall biosynthesis
MEVFEKGQFRKTRRSCIILSFVLPCYNESRLIERCIKSIQRAMCNLPHEIIVVDNGSTDNTVELAKGLGATIIYEPHKGVTRARQAGFKAAKYNLISCIDADSELPDDWLEYALKAINKEHVIAASGPLVFYDITLFKRIAVFMFYSFGKLTHLIWPMLQGGNCIIRRRALELAGGFDVSVDFYGEDTNTVMRLTKIGKVNFDLNMWVYSSGRRLIEEGMIVIGLRYIANYLWMHLVGRPWTTTYHDHRPN